jgi:hypothetical protein
MGNALIVTTVSEESLDQRFLFESDGKGGETRLCEKYGRERWYALMPDRLRELHPKAYYRLPMRSVDVWHPPREPRGIDKELRLRQAHCRAVRDSLEGFLNERLGRLRHMVRTGWWVLGDVRVRVTKCRPLPEYEMKTFFKGFKRLRTSKVEK